MAEGRLYRLTGFRRNRIVRMTVLSEGWLSVGVFLIDNLTKFGSGFPTCLAVFPS